jgi:uncharacterized protein involved in type VI secretion and phage assembly
MSDSDDLITDLARRAQDKYYGKYRGFVANNKDPDQLGRLQLRIPSVLGTEGSGGARPDEGGRAPVVTDWALPCLPFGGTAGLGWFVIPEQDAQVWVEFEEGELRRPIWVGTFWQKSGDAPADAQKTPPTTRLLQTPAGHIFQLDDEDSKEHIRLHHAGGAELVIDENGAITITDQAGNMITLDADQEQISIADTNDNAITMTATGVKIEDGNNNSIEFAPSGVTISSAGQIVLDANTVQLGGAGGEPVIKGTSFLTLFATHVHTAAGPGSPTTPPIPQGESTTLSTTVLSK